MIDPLIPSINARITAAYSNSASPVLFNTETQIGKIANVGVPTIGVWAESGSKPLQLAQQGIQSPSKLAERFYIRVVLPVVGGGFTTSDFEISKQCSLGVLRQFFLDKTNTFQPVVYTKANPSNPINAWTPCDPGPWRSLDMDHPLADEKTITRGFEMTFTFLFQIATGFVVSSPAIAPASA
jgi:hypothetical protein